MISLEKTKKSIHGSPSWRGRYHFILSIGDGGWISVCLLHVELGRMIITMDVVPRDEVRTLFGGLFLLLG